MFFAAVELKKDEGAHDAIKAFMYATSDNGALFSKLKLYGMVEVGRTRFARFSSDCGNYAPNILQRLRQEGRAVIAPSKSGYLVFMSDGRTGPFSTSQMQAVIAPGFGQLYKGPRQEFWENQFP